MLKKAAISIIALMMAHSLNGQIISPLHQMLSSNSPLNRPQVFRDLEDKIGDEFGKVEPGLRTDLLYKQMSIARQKIGAVIDSLRSAWEPTEAALSPEQVKRLTKIFENVLARSLSVVKNQETKEAILSALLDVLEKSGATAGATFSQNQNEVQKSETKIAEILVAKINEFIKAKTDQDDSKQKFLEALDKVHEALAQALDKAEHKVADVLDAFSRWLLAINTGLAISEGGKGAFAGGLLLSLAIRSSTQIGVYVNGQLSRTGADSTEPKQSLVGVQFRYAKDRCQIDLLASRLFGYKDLRVVEAMETGLGLSWRAGNSCIVGLAYFYLFVKEISDVHKIGLTLKGTKADSPGFLIGLARDINTTRPIIQFSFPVSMR